MVSRHCTQWDLLAPKASGLSQFGEGGNVSPLQAGEQAASLLDLKVPTEGEFT